MTVESLLLPAATGRFVRLVWRDAATAPVLSAATAAALKTTAPAQAARTSLLFSPLPASAASATGEALDFDLGGVLPVTELDLKLPPGTRVAPVRVQGRSRANEAWRELGSAVFYRLERDGAASTAPPLALQADVRYMRLLPDARSPALDPAGTRLIVSVRPAQLVFASQGRPPYTLQAGSAEAAAGALPVNTLIPQLDDERPRFGRAELGAWSEDAGAARQAVAAERQAALRPWLLWAVLLAGVAGLGFMVWRLARSRPAAG